MTVKEALLYAKQKLKNVPDRDVDAAWIVGLICGLRRGELHIQTEKILTPQQEEVLESVLNRVPLGNRCSISSAGCRFSILH